MVARSLVTVIHAERPDISQRGEFDLQRQYSAPRTLQFTASTEIFFGFHFIFSVFELWLPQSSHRGLFELDIPVCGTGKPHRFPHNPGKSDSYIAQDAQNIIDATGNEACHAAS